MTHCNRDSKEPQDTGENEHNQNSLFSIHISQPKHVGTQKKSAKTRSDRDKLCHFWSKMKTQESQNKLFLSIASYLVHLILEGFC